MHEEANLTDSTKAEIKSWMEMTADNMEAKLSDSEIKKPGEEIISSRQIEIDFRNAKIKSLEAK